jgi:trehalose 6-phosphate phosphatase
VFIGDDRTDEDGFAAVNRQGGVSIRVGPLPPSLPSTQARWQCDDVEDLAAWLAALPDRVKSGTAPAPRSG